MAVLAIAVKCNVMDLYMSTRILPTRFLPITERQIILMNASDIGVRVWRGAAPSGFRQPHG